MMARWVRPRRRQLADAVWLAPPRRQPSRINGGIWDARLVARRGCGSQPLRLLLRDAQLVRAAEPVHPMFSVANNQNFK